MLNSSAESGHPGLVSNFRGNASNILPLRRMFAVVLSYIIFIMLRLIPSMPAFWIFFFSQMAVEFCQQISLHRLR